MKDASPLRILMTADSVGGVWTYALDLAHELSKAGAQVTLAVLGPEPTADQLWAVRGAEVVATGLPLDWTADGPQALEDAAHAVAELARRTGADLVHLNSPALAAWAEFEAPVIGACHSCLATWWDAVRSGPLPEDFAWRVEALRRGYARCDLLVAPSRAFAEATAARYGVAAPAVVHNGRRPVRTPARDKEPLVFTAGRLWDDGKNVALLDAAAARLSAPVFAAGPREGPNGQRIRLANAFPLGRLSEAEVAAWTGRAQVFASAAIYEPFGLSVLEAAQAGCALVLSDIPTFRELWTGAAVFAPASDEAAFADALQGLLDVPDRAAALGQTARARAESYSVEAMGEGVLALYRALVDAREEAAA